MEDIKISSQNAKLFASFLNDNIDYIKNYIENHKQEYIDFVDKEKSKQTIVHKQKRTSRKMA